VQVVAIVLVQRGQRGTRRQVAVLCLAGIVWPAHVVRLVKMLKIQESGKTNRNHARQEENPTWSEPPPRLIATAQRFLVRVSSSQA
jgi:hypothetical protein